MVVGASILTFEDGPVWSGLGDCSYPNDGKHFQKRKGNWEECTAEILNRLPQTASVPVVHPGVLP